ncbi:small multi-drug export protein [Candidatus Woesearchaeota archaeon]|nr:small multi-drug export protein [Candidatus Woesearchaeota archaeon]
MLSAISFLVQGFLDRPLLAMVLITLIPALELRASIPYGILATDYHWTSVFLICVITNILLGPLIYFLLDKIINLFFFIKPFERLYHKSIDRAQRKLEPYVNKYGILGVSIFIGIPLPGSGSYTGALGSYVLGLGYKRFFIANVIGVLIAAVVVTIVVLTGNELFSFFVNGALI